MSAGAEAELKVVRSFFDPEEGEGRVIIEVGGERYVFKIFKNPEKRGYLIEFNGVMETLTRLPELLEDTELAGYARNITRIIKNAIYKAQITKRKQHRVLVIERVQLRSGVLEILLRDDGKVVLRYGNNRKVIGMGGKEFAEALSELLPLEELSEEVGKKVREVLERLKQGAITGSEVLVIADGASMECRFSSCVVDGRLVTFIPFVGTYYSYESGETRRGILGLVIVTNERGEVEKIDIMANPITIKVGVRNVYKDFLRGWLELGENPNLFFPSLELVREIKRFVEEGKWPGWSEVYDYVSEKLRSYAYLEEAYQRIATLYAIAQNFFDLVPYFPILRIIGESGSGKRQVANFIRACAPVSFTVVDPSEASIFRLADAFHPTITIDETMINRDTALLLNAGFEQDKFVPRVRNLESGKQTIDLFNLYSPKIIVSRPGKLRLPDDTISRTIEVKIQKVKNKVYPPQISEEDRKKLVTLTILLKAGRWAEYLETYRRLRNELVGVDPRTRDTYLPLLTVAYLVARERADPGLFKQVLEDMARVAEERGGVSDLQKKVIIGILKRVIERHSGVARLSDVVRYVLIRTKDIAEILNARDSSFAVKAGRFLRESPFKVGESRSGGHKVYKIDLAKLHSYVVSYSVDLGELKDEELATLNELTGLDWRGAAPRLDKWIREVVERLCRGGGGDPPSPPHPLPDTG